MQRSATTYQHMALDGALLDLHHMAPGVLVVGHHVVQPLHVLHMLLPAGAVPGGPGLPTVLLLLLLLLLVLWVVWVVVLVGVLHLCRAAARAARCLATCRESAM
jgi:hypothetical protein